jgi:DNA recombination protein RmuC
MLLMGACVGASAATAAAMVVTKKFPSGEQKLHRMFEASLQTMQLDIYKTIADSESRMGSQLQTQERQLNNHSASWMEKLSGIPQANKELNNLQTKMNSLQTLFAHPKQRGTLGELHLERLICDVFPPTSYEFQSTLNNGKRPDCVLKFGTGEKLCIDSKFPLDAFMLDDADKRTQKVTESLKKHIKDVSTKYIVAGETSDYAVLFVPSESIFLQIVEHSYLVIEAHKSKVLLASPTTLVAVLTTLQSVVRNVQLQENSLALISEMTAMDADLDRLSDRSEKAEKHLDQARESLRLMGVSMDKVVRRRAKLDGLYELHSKQVADQPRKAVATNVASGVAPESQPNPINGLLLKEHKPIKI